MNKELEKEVMKKFIDFNMKKISDLEMQIDELNSELQRYQKRLDELEGLENGKIL